jgi:Kef-type K+ transport system membrane component KefB
MDYLDLPQFLGLLAAILAAAKLFGALAQWIGQPAVLGELCAGLFSADRFWELITWPAA